jgi:hypothetical protein
MFLTRYYGGITAPPRPIKYNTVDQKNKFVIFTSLSTQYYDDCNDHWYYDLSSDAAEEKI